MMKRNTLLTDKLIYILMMASILLACTLSLKKEQGPIISAKPSQAPTQTTTPRWIEYEKALAKALLPIAYPIEESGVGLCEWVILGSKENEVYVWAECQVASTASGSAGSVPAVIYLSSNGKIEEVALPRDGTDYGPDIQKLFPPDVQDKINNLDSYFDVKAAMDHIALRRKDPTIPPMIVEAGTSLP
jgi:hypothetical protein